MRKVIESIFKRERGQALIAVLLLLVVGGIIIAPFLLLTGTTIRYVKTTGDQLKGLYAADAGIEYCYWRIVRYGAPFAPGSHNNPGDFRPLPTNGGIINGMNVNIVTEGSDFPYTVWATVTSGGATIVTKSATVDNAALADGSRPITLAYN